MSNNKEEIEMQAVREKSSLVDDDHGKSELINPDNFDDNQKIQLDDPQNVLQPQNNDDAIEEVNNSITPITNKNNNDNGGQTFNNVRDFKKIFRNTNFVKDLKILKEQERTRRSMLIFGCADMKDRLINIRHADDNQRRERKKDDENMDDTKPKKRCKDRFLFNPQESKFLSTFDSMILIVIAYSCFTTFYYAAFNFPSDNKTALYLEHTVLVFFTLDIILNFMREYIEPDSTTWVREHSKIAKKYFKSGWFFFDVLATFPFYIFDTAGDLIWFKLLRMIRIPRIVNLLDLSKFNKSVEAVFSGQTRGKKVVFQLIMKNVYKVFRLILMTVIITFFTGCTFYFVSDQQKQLGGYAGPTFITTFGLNEKEETYQLITSCYYSITTLSTVGYGDLYPISNFEMIFGIMIMLAGVGFFSLIMGSFIEIISTFNQNLGVEEHTFELHNWMTLLTRFRENKPLPNSLYRQINQHFKYYWANNRLSQVQKDNEFINALPRSIKRGIIVHYLFDDIFYNFRFFFNPQKYKDSKFLYDIAFGLKPRHFSEKEEENIIYDEEEEVLEMYFIMSGTVGIGYHLYQQPLEKMRYKLTHFLGSNNFFGDYYLCNNMKAEFVHIATTEVEAFALSKKFLMRKVFPKYPQIFREIKDDLKYRYNSTIKDEIMKHKHSHIEVVNKRSTYNAIQLRAKKAVDFSSQQLLVMNTKSDVGTTNLRQQFQERIVGIEEEMKKIDGSLVDFLSTVTSDFSGLIGQIEQMKENMDQLKKESKESHEELEKYKQQNA